MKFSIVMPTRNRADKLACAIRSATRQSFDDYEIIISDNCSTDHTQRVIQEHKTDRCRVIRPHEPMAMSRHWEFALGHAKGDRILVLCDDDALMPNCLERLDRIVAAANDPDFIQFECFTYVYDDGVSEDKGSTIRLPAQVKDDFRRMDLERSLRLAFWRLDGNMPKLLNSAVHRRMLDAIRQKSGRLFGIWAPDYAVGCRLLALSKNGVRTGPLAIWGENMQSYGPGSRRDQGILRQFMEEHSEWKGTLANTPYPNILTVVNVLFDTMEIARRELNIPKSFGIDPIRFRETMIDELKMYADRNVAGAAEDMVRVEKDLSLVQRQRMLSPANWTESAAYWWRRQCEKRASRSYRKSPGEKTHKFSNILDAAIYAGSLKRAA